MVRATFRYQKVGGGGHVSHFGRILRTRVISVASGTSVSSRTNRNPLRYRGSRAFAIHAYTPPTDEEEGALGSFRFRALRIGAGGGEKEGAALIRAAGSVRARVSGLRLTRVSAK